jgi:FkbM family methyltransferase
MKRVIDHTALPGLVVAISRPQSDQWWNDLDTLVAAAERRGVRPSICCARDAGHGRPLPARHACSLDELQETIERALGDGGPSTRTAILASDEIGTLEQVGDRKGLVPVLVGSPRFVLPESAVHAPTFAMLAPYFVEERPKALLALALLAPGQIRRVHEEQRTRSEAAHRRMKRLYVFGAGQTGRQALVGCSERGVRVAALLDNNASLWGTEVSGTPVIDPAAAEFDGSVVVVAVGRGVAAAKRQLAALGAEEVFGLSEFYFVVGAESEPERDYAADLAAARWPYHSLYVRLADTRSRVVLDRVVEHRLTLATEPLADAYDAAQPQWFEEGILPKRADHVFVDGGAFDGDTVAAFVAMTGGAFRSIHAFEPDGTLYERGSLKFPNDARIKWHPFGLSDHRGRRGFIATGGRTTDLVEGDGVEMVALDEQVDEPVTFIKLDVEGAELAALSGASQHIGRDFPAVAVAVYHRASDLWRIPERLVGIRPEYELRLRHYTEISYETVLYATPAAVVRMGSGAS